jgi:hypothetical protein
MNSENIFKNNTQINLHIKDKLTVINLCNYQFINNINYSSIKNYQRTINKA